MSLSLIEPTAPARFVSFPKAAVSPFELRPKSILARGAEKRFSFYNLRRLENYELALRPLRRQAVANNGTVQKIHSPACISCHSIKPPKGPQVFPHRQSETPAREFGPEGWTAGSLLAGQGISRSLVVRRSSRSASQITFEADLVQFEVDRMNS